jgi:mono/diheme cytochrome c family protein
VTNRVIIFLIATVVGFGIGYLFQLSDSPAKTEVAKPNQSNSSPTEQVDQPATVSAEAQIFNKKNCLSCHSVSGLGLKGGATGPDLSKAYSQVEGKHGKPLNEFLKEPTSAVMSSVISGNPLTEDEINEIVQVLQQVPEK